MADANGTLDQPTMFSTAVAALRARVLASGHGYAQSPDDLEFMLKGTGILGPALAQAIHDMIRNATLAGADEETRTAGFFGHLASNLDWFALMASLTSQIDDKSASVLPRPCNLYWAPQSKRREGKYGGDFGLAMRVGEDTFRIVLYQAKRVAAKGIASIHRSVTDELFADENLINKPSLRLRTRGVRPNIGVTELSKLHQIHRLETWRNHGLKLVRDARTNQRGKVVKTDELYPWCRYVFWFDAVDASLSIPTPKEQSSKVIFDRVRTSLASLNGEKRGRMDAFKVKAIGSDFGRSVLCVGPHEMVVTAEEAANLVGALHELGETDFYITDETGEGRYAPIWRKIFAQEKWNLIYLGGSTSAGMAPSTAHSNSASSSETDKSAHNHFVKPKFMK